MSGGAWHLVFVTFLIAPSTESGSCPSHWLRLTDRCVGLYPVWASWCSAQTLCSQSDSRLDSPQSQKDLEFLQRMVRKLSVPVWIGGFSALSERHKGNVWIRGDTSDFKPQIRTNQTSGNGDQDEVCLGMTPNDDDVKNASCGELRFYICSKNISFESTEQAAGSSGLSPGVSLFSVMWHHSETVADEILRSSSLLLQFRSGSVSRSCFDLFVQQEALYMGRLYSTLQALETDAQEVDPRLRALLLRTKLFYQTKQREQYGVAAPQWLQDALQSFHSLVAEEPVYLLVALSARSVLNQYILQSLPLPGHVSGLESKNLLKTWREEREKDLEFVQRFREVVESLQGKMHVFKSIDIFRRHMMNQKSLHKHVECPNEEETRQFHLLPSAM